MRFHLLIGLLAALACPAVLRAQVWSKADSVWLSGILSGKDTLRLDPETERAIREGRLLDVAPEAAGQMQLQGTKLPIVIDFSDYVRKSDDTSRYLVPLRELPPQVFWLYGQNLDPRDAARYSAFDRDKQAELMVTPEMDGLSFNLAAALGYALSPSYRQKVKNRKNATAHRTYDQLPSLAMQQKQRAYRQEVRKRELRRRHRTLRYDEDGLPLPDIVPTRRDTLPPDSLLRKKQPLPMRPDSLASALPTPSGR